MCYVLIMEETMSTARIDELARAGMHLGYARRSKHPAMDPYIFGVRTNIQIFDLAAVDAALERAKVCARDLGRASKTILFVGTKEEARVPVLRAAQALDMPRVTVRWLGGTLTNFKQIRRRVDELERLRSDRAAGTLERYTKKERLRIDQEVAKLEQYFDGLVGMAELPSALVVVDPKEESTAVREAALKGIPTIALGNTDVDPRGIQYLVPGNDNSRSSITFFLDEITTAYRHP